MTKQAISPLRRRMIEDMAIRKLAPKTQHDYVQRVKDFAVFLGRSPDQAQPEDVRGFRLHLSSIGAHAPKINATVSALRFFFNVTLDRPELAKLPERPGPGSLLDRPGDSLGKEQPPRDDVAVPGVGDHFNRLVEQVALDEVELS